MNCACKCDNCSQGFDIKPQKQKATHELHGEIIRQFFSCPHCGAEFNFGFSNERVAALVAENV